MCIEREREREKVDFKSREVNCLKECALALMISDSFRNITYYRLTHCTQVSDQCPLGR